MKPAPIIIQLPGEVVVPAIKEAVHAGFGGPLAGAVGGAVIGGTFSGRPLAPLEGEPSKKEGLALRAYSGASAEMDSK